MKIDFSGFPDVLREYADGETFEMTVDYSSPDRSALKPEDMLIYWACEEGVLRTDMPDTVVGDELWLRYVAASGEAQLPMRCARMTDERLYFERIPERAGVKVTGFGMDPR